MDVDDPYPHRDFEEPCTGECCFPEAYPKERPVKNLRAVCDKRFRIGEAYEDAEGRIYQFQTDWAQGEFIARCIEKGVSEVVRLPMGRVLIEKGKGPGTIFSIQAPKT